MRNSIKEAIGDTVQDLLNAGFNTSFTQEELEVLEVKVPEIHMTSGRIRHIREEKKLTQPVFAKLLNVSASSVKLWELGKKKPTGSAKVLLELLEKYPNLLDYRIGLK